MNDKQILITAAQALDAAAALNEDLLVHAQEMNEDEHLVTTTVWLTNLSNSFLHEALQDEPDEVMVGVARKAIERWQVAARKE